MIMNECENSIFIFVQNRKEKKEWKRKKESKNCFSLYFLSFKRRLEKRLSAKRFGDQITYNTYHRKIDPIDVNKHWNRCLKISNVINELLQGAAIMYNLGFFTFLWLLHLLNQRKLIKYQKNESGFQSKWICDCLFFK